MGCNDSNSYRGDDTALLTNMLCGLATRVEKAKMSRLISADASLKVWWEKHKEEDERQKASEAADLAKAKIVKAAKKKLNPAEREALGLR